MTAQKASSEPLKTSDLDQQSLAAIRDLLASEPTVEPQPVAERVAEQKAATPAAAPKKPARRSARAKPEQSEPRLDTPRKVGIVGRLKAKITGYRPTAKHLVVAALVLLVLFRPWLVVGILFITAFILTGTFLILGYDGFWHRMMSGARWYARRRPSRAAHVQRKLDAFAMKFDGFLDRFPEGSVDGLYLPDFGELAAAEAQHDEALDRRFDSLRESGA